MDIEQILNRIMIEYPNKNIVFSPNNENPTEIIVELEPTKDHPEHSLALAVVGRSEPHFHKKTTEILLMTSAYLAANSTRFFLCNGKRITKNGHSKYPKVQKERNKWKKWSVLGPGFTEWWGNGGYWWQLVVGSRQSATFQLKPSYFIIHTL